MTRWPMLAVRLRHSPVGARARIGASVPRQLARRGPTSRRIIRAMTATALDRIPAEERSWAGRIETRRAELIADGSMIEPVFDPRPPEERGSWWGVYEPLKVGAASWLMSLPRTWCLLLMRLVSELRPRSCLELGTGFGISGAYQAAALDVNGSGRLTTLEGAGEWGEIARRGFSQLGLTRVQTLIGPIDETLPEAVEAAPFDFAFVDAEHTEAATVGHFGSMVPHLAENAVVVLDDIDFNAGTRRAWSVIGRHPRVSAALSLGSVGIVTISGARD
jgi:predicted O-methyltransferase YrrM